MNSPSSNLPPATEAILFLPSIGEQGRSDSAFLTLVARLAAAVDQGAHTSGAKFRVDSEVESSRVGLGERQFLVCKLVRTEPDGSERRVMDVYRLDYHDALIQDYEQLSSFKRALITAFQATGGILRLLKAMFRKTSGLGIRRSLQVLMAFAIWVSLLLYFIILLASLLSALVQSLDALTQSSPTGALGALHTYLAAHPTTQKALVTTALALTTLTSLLPESLKAELVRRGANYVRMSAYLTINHQRSATLGRFHSTLEHIVEKAHYQHVHLLAYSFGSIVALDALFPPTSNSKIAYPRFSCISKLITIGCPFDFVRQLWPQYFDNRQAASSAPTYWLNVYTPPDALGSNFRDDELNQPATVQLGNKAPENLTYERGDYGLLDAMSFLALRTHGIYWKQDEDIQDQGCLREAIAVAFSGEPILQ